MDITLYVSQMARMKVNRILIKAMILMKKYNKIMKNKNKMKMKINLNVQKQ